MQAINMNLYGNYRNRTFNDIWPEVTEFATDYNQFNSDILDNSISNTAVNTVFMLLSAYYGNSTVASQNEYQFKLKLFSIIFMYGPTWEKRLEIQKGIRGLLKNGELSPELLQGGKAIYNTALNPSNAVSPDHSNMVGTNTLTELQYINSQNTTNYRKSTPEAYSILAEMLETDVTKEFLDKFKKLFLTVVSPELPLWYKTNTEVDDDE